MKTKTLYYLVISILLFYNVAQIKIFLTFLTSYIPLILFLTLLLLQDSQGEEKTLMENYFSSDINDDCIAGNLISPISNHNTQSLIIPNCTITQNSKKNIYKQNFKHFSSKKFIADLEKVKYSRCF